MKKLYWLILILFAPIISNAQCNPTNGTLAYTCVAGSTSAQIQTALNLASDKTVITLLPGTYIVGNYPKFSNSKGATIICATTPLTVGASQTNPCFIDARPSAINQPSKVAFGTDLIDGENTFFYRVSGFVIDQGGGSPSFGTLYWDSYNGPNKNGKMRNLRVDHNTFQNGANGSQTTLIGSTLSYMRVNGVYDHNLWTNATQMATVIWISPTESTTPSPLGTSDNLFLEDNTLTFASVGNGSAEGCTDGWGSSSFVVRHNVSTNCLWAAHGVTHAGGPLNYEFYLNDIRMDGGAGAFKDCYRCFHHQGSGETIFFGNKFTQCPATTSGCTGAKHGSEVISVLHYRDVIGTNGSYNISSMTAVGSALTYNDTFASDCGTVDGAGNLLHSCGGWFHGRGWTNPGNNTYVLGTGGKATAGGSTATQEFATSQLNTEVNETGGPGKFLDLASIDGGSPQCDGTVVTFGYNDGNRSPLATNRGYPCWHQPGRDWQGNIKPMYAWNNYWTDDNSLVPLTVANAGGTDPTFTNHLQAGRDWFNSVSNLANSTPTTPFDGVNGASATGMGFGLLANRPLNCASNTFENSFNKGTSGVGYFATNVGPQGTFYQCSSTNNWTVWYVPYTYPHPLTSGSGSPPLVVISPSPVNYGNVNIQPSPGVSQAITITNTGGSTLNVTQVLVSGAFTYNIGSGTCGTLPFSIGAGSNCTVNVTASPTTLGPSSGTFTITDTAAGSPHSVTLNVTGTSPVFVLSILPGGATNYNFGPVVIPGPVSSPNFTLKNNGTGTGNVSISIGGANPTQFGTTNVGCGSTLLPGASCTLQVTFSPPASVTYTATLVNTDSINGITVTDTLNGTGINSPTIPTAPCITCVLFTNGQPTPSSPSSVDITFTPTITLVAKGTKFTGATCKLNGTFIPCVCGATDCTISMPLSIDILVPIP